VKTGIALTGWEEAPGQMGSAPWGPQESALTYVGLLLGLATLPKPLNHGKKFC
jgi:hypothetical protein